MISTTYIWAIIGIVLIVIEIFTSTFFILFFGVAALIVALLRILGVDHLATEIIIFAVVGTAGTLIFRGKIKDSLRSNSSVSQDKDTKIILDADVPAGGLSSITYQGSTWTAVNESARDLKKGETVFIDRVDGVKLIIKKQ
jgi:membrane protein implicated in regulation of membrane protease activity